MHLIERDYQLLAVHLVDDSVCGGITALVTMVSITWIQSYDVTWAESAQLLLIIAVSLLIVVSIARCSSGVICRGAFASPPRQMQKHASVHASSHMLDEELGDR